jgi:uncharacterized protein YkwD
VSGFRFGRPRTKVVAYTLAAGLLATAVSGAVRGHGDRAQAQTATVNCDVDVTRLAPDAEELAVLDQTNAYRAANNLPPLQLSFALTRAALWKSADMAARQYGAHDDGLLTWSQRFADCGYTIPDAYIGENLAGGNADAATTMQQWKDSPAHNANLLDPPFVAVGIKRVQSSDPADPYGTYWSMEFASQLDLDLYSGLAGQ